MADEHGKPLHELAPSTTPHTPDDEGPARTGARAYEKCVACRQFHGGVNAGLRCLESEVRRLRGELADARDQLSIVTRKLAAAEARGESLD